MTRVIAIANQKGGAGKSTTAINLACGWARLTKPGNILLIDIDPQANATAVLLGMEFATGPRQVGVDLLYEVLLQQAAVKDVIKNVPLDKSGKYKKTILDILPAHLQLSTLERKLYGEFQVESRLTNAMKGVVDWYEAIIIDCPPSLGLLTLNALMLANEVIIPVDPGLFPLIGLGLLNETIGMVQAANPNLKISGIVPTMSDRTVLGRETHEQLSSTYPDLVLPAIPRRVAYGEAHASGSDIFTFAPESDAAQAYINLVKEVIKRGKA